MVYQYPKSYNYFHDLFANGRTKDGWAAFQFPTNANPHIDQAEIDEMRRALPRLVARQEIDAEFVELAGALFKREHIRVIESEPVGAQWVRAWDLAFTQKTVNDKTASVRLTLTNDGCIVVANVTTASLEWPEAVRLIAETARADGPAVRQGIEVVAAQRGMLQTLLREPALAGYSLQPIEVHRDKVTRALPLLSRAEQGKLAIVRGAWNQAFIDELCAFPEGRHDDQVDAATGAMTLLSAPSGAITEASLKQIRIGRFNFASRRTFAPRTLGQGAFQGYFET
jgi:predicted phage terminase large subunit-like protein